MNIVSTVRNLPTKAKLLLGVSLFFIITLPLFIWGLIANKFLITQKAQVTRVNVDITGAPFLGPTDTPITIVEFGDFQCTFCKNFHDTALQPLLSAYPNKIKFVWKNFPLTTTHPQAEVAAEAAMCANEQNKFWEMSDAMFADQTKLSAAELATTAASLNLDLTQFNSCLDTSKYSAAIQKDVTDGTGYGVTSTPTFFINGIILQGAQPLSAFQSIIDSELATPSPSPTESPTASPTPTGTPTSATDDVYFAQNLTTVDFITTGQNPNISIDPTQIQLGKTYIVNVNFRLQNSDKTNQPAVSTTSAVLKINNFNIGNTQIFIPLIASHADGASYSLSGVYTATSPSTKVEIIFDPDNLYPETNETNNSLVFNFAPPSTPTPTPVPTETPVESPTPTATPNWCNGTCGSNYNCQGGLFCSSGFCRNPDCPSDNTCGCTTPTPTPTPTIIASMQISTSIPSGAPRAKESPTPTPFFGANRFLQSPTPTPVSTPKIAPANLLTQYGVYGGIAATAIVVIIVTIFAF